MNGFLDGQSLANLPGYAPRTASVLSVVTVALELALPVVLVVAPRVGIALVLALHLAFATQLPGLWSFSLTMVAIAGLFMPPERSAA